MCRLGGGAQNQGNLFFNDLRFFLPCGASMRSVQDTQIGTTTGQCCRGETPIAEHFQTRPRVSNAIRDLARGRATSRQNRDQSRNARSREVAIARSRDLAMRRNLARPRNRNLARPRDFWMVAGIIQKQFTFRMINVLHHLSLVTPSGT